MDKDILLSELMFKAIRSSGSGGQHVNKTSSKVELQWNLEESQIFSEDQKARLRKKLATRLTTDNRLILQCAESRSQHKNKTLVIQRFIELLEEALKKKKKRKATKIPKSVVEDRLKKKKKQSEKKANRKPPDI